MFTSVLPSRLRAAFARLRKGRRGSVLVMSIVLMSLAGFSVMMWILYLNNATRAAKRDRDRTMAFYMAEAGVEQVVDYFNNPGRGGPGKNPYTNLTAVAGNYPKANEPADYESKGWHRHPASLPLAHPNLRDSNTYRYNMFEPYTMSYETDNTDTPIIFNGRLMVTKTTFFRNLGAGNNKAISKTSKIPTQLVNIAGNARLELKDKNGNVLARVVSLKLVHPSEIPDEELPSDIRVVTRVEATAEVPVRAAKPGEKNPPKPVTATVQTYLSEAPLLAIMSPGAIVTRGNAEFNGHYNVRWGEIWIDQEPVITKSEMKTKIPKVPGAGDPDYGTKGGEAFDRWFLLKTSKNIRGKDGSGLEYANGGEKDGWSAGEVPTTSPLRQKPYDPAHLVSGISNDFKQRGNLLQNWTLDFQRYNKYDEMKKFVNTNGFRYLWTDMAGNIYGTETKAGLDYGKVVKKDLEGWLHIEPTDPNYTNLQDLVVFIDSVPVDDAGTPKSPDADGMVRPDNIYYPRDPALPIAKMAELKTASGAFHCRGAIFVCANVAMSGGGNPPEYSLLPAPLNVLMPTGAAPASLANNESKIWLNGFMYCYGVVEGAGSKVVYGSIYAEKGYGASGDPTVFYNYRMKDGSWLNLNTSAVMRTLWNIRK